MSESLILRDVQPRGGVRVIPHRDTIHLEAEFSDGFAGIAAQDAMLTDDPEVTDARDRWRFLIRLGHDIIATVLLRRADRPP